MQQFGCKPTVIEHHERIETRIIIQRCRSYITFINTTIRRCNNYKPVFLNVTRTRFKYFHYFTDESIYIVNRINNLTGRSCLIAPESMLLTSLLNTAELCNYDIRDCFTIDFSNKSISGFTVGRSLSFSIGNTPESSEKLRIRRIKADFQIFIRLFQSLKKRRRFEFVNSLIDIKPVLCCSGQQICPSTFFTYPFFIVGKSVKSKQRFIRHGADNWSLSCIVRLINGYSGCTIDNHHQYVSRSIFSTRLRIIISQKPFHLLIARECKYSKQAKHYIFYQLFHCIS